MTEDVAGAVDAGSLAVPEAEHAVELALSAQFRLLRAPDRGRGNVLVEAGLEANVVFVERSLRADELLIESAEGGAAIASDVTRGIEAGAAITLLLHQAQAHDSLEAGHENPALGQVVFVIERDLIERHHAGLRGQCALATKQAPGIRWRDIVRGGVQQCQVGAATGNFATGRTPARKYRRCCRTGTLAHCSTTVGHHLGRGATQRRANIRVPRWPNHRRCPRTRPERDRAEG